MCNQTLNKSKVEINKLYVIVNDSSVRRDLTENRLFIVTAKVEIEDKNKTICVLRDIIRKTSLVVPETATLQVDPKDYPEYFL